MAEKVVTLRDLSRVLDRKNIPYEYLGDEKGLEKPLSSPIFISPGISLAGFWDYFPTDRLILLKKREMAFFRGLADDEKEKIFQKFVEVRATAFILQKSVHCDGTVLEFSKKNNIPILLFDLPYKELQILLLDILEDLLAEVKTIHGVMVDVADQGILIIGESGIGKSECALELVRRGYRFIADDMVRIKKRRGRLVASISSKGSHYIEIRGVGIIDIKELYGLRAVAEEKEVNCVVNLVTYEKERHFERLGIDREKFRLMGSDLPMYTVPVTPGKSIGTVVEVIAKNEYANTRGINTPMKFADGLMSEIKGKISKDEK